MTSNQKAFKVKANEFVFELDQTDIDDLDISQISPHGIHLITGNNRSVPVQVLAFNGSTKQLKLEVDGEPFEVEIKDSLDQMLEVMGFGTAANKHIKEIKAPMPGLVLSISVTEGQAVKEGDRILILEAMKMENSILIHADATIKRIAVKAGQAVEKGQVLVELE